ncbi:hypothetical protein [Haloferax larsenii]|uniref:Uncharacterized protein n=1 Tax=Haloferax larsenii TaxID=302484 RepID=A0A1H7G8L5_HALLR|nr:hypothetical protein [Haloferax larsenii]SEK34471.1 hypothetical protein SAMN04488691_101246 [Haloferax larsenii]
MHRRDFLCGIAASSSIAVAGCSGVIGERETEKTTHHHVRSSTIRNGVPSGITQTVFILDLVEKSQTVELLVSPRVDFGTYHVSGPKQTTVHLVIDDFVDEWQQQWTEQNGLAGTLSFESRPETPVTIIAKTEFEEGGSIETSRYEEIQFASDSN